MKKLVILLLALASLTATALGCSSTQFSALNAATETPSRTPRPTFTPRPSATSKPSPTSTDIATDTPPAPADTVAPLAVASDTPTKKPAATKPPSTSAPPTAAPPTATPAPQYSITLSSNTPCPSTSIYVIYIRLQKGSGGGSFVGGYTYALFDTAGNPLMTPGGGPVATGQTVPDNQVYKMTQGGCPRAISDANPLPYNGKMDAGPFARAGTKTVVLKFVKSASDLTPLSAGVTLDFSTAREYWLYYVTP